jgi:hypothetical protein
MSMKNSSDTIGNRTRDLMVCSAVPQPLHHRLPHLANSTVSNQRRPKSRISSLYLSHPLWNMLSLVQTTQPQSASSVQLHTNNTIIIVVVVVIIIIIIIIIHSKSAINVCEKVNNDSVIIQNISTCSYINMVMVSFNKSGR